LKDLAVVNGENPDDVPKEGYFEISRAYVKDPPQGKLKYKLCARRVPSWIPIDAFKYIFTPYVSDINKKGCIVIHRKKSYDTYPLVNFIDTKDKSRMVFITFDSSTRDALFALLMTKKTRIVHPNDHTKKCEIIFTHAFDNKNNR
ncbi:unnamed protein product, partial [marine sediment metagenome]